ncbi:hypothetical protein VTO42DRAFT_8818 [Malbranchea cinnamomea]
MEPSRPPGNQVIIPHHGPQSNGDAQRLPRPLSVDEALRFSPMTSAPVFGLDSIMRPDIGHASLLDWPLPYDTASAGRMIDILDNETQSNPDKSAELSCLQADLQRLLKGDNLTNYKFTLPSRICRPHPSSSRVPQYSEPSSHHLGPFAKTILDSTNVLYSYPSTATPLPRNTDMSSRALPTPILNQRSSEAASQESRIHGQSIPVFHGTGPVLKPVIMVPPLPPSSSLGEYQPIRYLPSSQRKVNSPNEDAAEALRIRDQKEMVDAALLRLQDLLQEIFEAEDQLQPDASSERVSSSNKFLKVAESNGDRCPILLSETHTVLQKSLRAVTNFGRLHDIPTKYLNRLQKLCEMPILSASSIDLSLESPPSEDEAMNWVRKLEDMHNSLLSISTLLQTMSGSQDMKNFCPEDTIRAIPTALNHVFDTCIIPAVECRVSGKNSALFSVYSSHKQVVGGLTSLAKRILALLASFISTVDLAEDTIVAIEFLVVKLIFVENAHNDKDSTLGFQKYEAVRRSAMDVIAKIFAKYPDQRAFILDEILVSLEKLPSTRQSARQFKLADGKHIQLLSALVIQLVQTTALQRDPGSLKSKRKPHASHKIAVQLDESDGDEQEKSDSDDNSGDGSPLRRLSNQVEPLYDNALRSAQYITRFIVQRAMASTKTGDQPYRNLLDLFTEDLINVLGSPDWPGAELLLRVLASQMVGIADHDKSPANAKNMALELLGWMGSAISQLTATAQHLSNAIDDTDSELTNYLRQLSDGHANRTLHIEDLTVINGPYRVALEYLDEQNVGKSQLSSARGYLLTQWGKTVCSIYLEGNATSANHNVQSLAKTMNEMLFDPRWLEVNSAFDRISTQQARLAYHLTVLSSPFCKAFDTIVKVLLGSITSDQAKVRSRSLKSVIQMLERDPSLLDRDASVVSVIFRCAADSSPMVRDSALTLIAKCITLKPGLEEECSRAILACSADQTLGVRKRCIGLMKEIYLQTKRHNLRLSIIEKLLERLDDHEESLAVIARQALEDIWFSPFYQSIHPTQNAPQVKVSLEELVDLIVGSVRNSENVTPSLELFLKKLLNSDEKAVQPSFDVCKAAVAVMFERVVHNSDSDDKPALSALLRSITVFAKAKAALFTPDQLETLHPYIGHLASADDLLLFRSVVVIYRCVLPHISSAHNALLKEVQNDLFKSVSKLARAELNEVMACLWTINNVLQNTERLVRLAISVLKGIKQAAAACDSTNSDQLGRIRSYIRIAGCVGKHCDLERFQANFQQTFPEMKSGSVAGYMVDFIAPYAQSNYPRELRLMALESLGSICQSWPAQFGRKPARLAFSSVFDEDARDLQNIVLKSFLDFFAMHEGKLEKLMQPTDTTNAEPTSRLGGSLKASDNDGAAALIAQNFLKHMLRAAISGQDSYAITAIELIASINRQGLIHPKECAGVLVALETSTNPLIAKPAFETHKMLHQQHESMFEREYMRAIQEAFYYQRDVVGDPTGAHYRPFSAKLAPLFEIVKTSSSKYLKKFLTNLCSKADFDLKNLDTLGNPPEHLLFARFVCHNIAFFEYGQIAELLATVACLERIVATTGTIVAHAIETDLFPMTLEPSSDGGLKPEGNAMSPDNDSLRCDPKVLKRLSIASSVILMMWETRSYLRRLYNLNAHSRQKEGKATQKDMSKAPAKVQGISGERYWEAIVRTMNSLENTESMATICKQLATLLSIDEELKVATDEDYDSIHSAGEVEDTGAAALHSTMNGSKMGKRKSSGSVDDGTPRKVKRGRPSSSKKRPSADLEDDADFD